MSIHRMFLGQLVAEPTSFTVRSRWASTVCPEAHRTWNGDEKTSPHWPRGELAHAAGSAAREHSPPAPRPGLPRTRTGVRPTGLLPPDVLRPDWRAGDTRVSAIVNSMYRLTE
ncbi:MAG: hypothetical protein LC799_28980 [Actinobacteria bacterium]|nr:hypothetical protein [Actinomycetota bacterium]